MSVNGVHLVLISFLKLRQVFRKADMVLGGSVGVTECCSGLDAVPCVVISVP